jgi:hypothetical protein
LECSSICFFSASTKARQFFECLRQDRPLAEAQQAGNMGESHPEIHIGKAQQDNGGKEAIVSFIIGDIGPRQNGDVFNSGRIGPVRLFPQALPNPDRLRIIDIPGMLLPDLHISVIVIQIMVFSVFIPRLFSNLKAQKDIISEKLFYFHILTINKQMIANFLVIGYRTYKFM